MPAPAFEFTTRAAPIVQFGRPERPTGDDRWRQTHWGEGFWGNADWEPLIWTDLTCEIHEIRTVTGRGSASDRFVPGTAHIVASNVHDVADMIFPHVPGVPAYDMEFVPQPPIQLEETLQAPDAATVVSNGWSFTDDFETRPPRWVFPPVYATDPPYPTRPFVWHDGSISPEMYADTSAENYQAHGVAHWTGLYPHPLPVSFFLTTDAFTWPSEPAGGTPRIVYELYTNGNTVDRSCNCVRVTLSPVFGGNNTGTVQVFRMNADGSGSGVPATIVPPGLGSNGAFPALRLTVTTEPSAGVIGGGVVDVGEFFGTLGSFATGPRIGFAVHYIEGDIPAGTSRGAPHVTGFEAFDFIDDFDRPVGAGWRTVPKSALGPMIQVGGGMRPPMTFTAHPAYGGDYRGEGSAQWTSSFDGDQFIEVALAGMNKPVDLDGTDDTLLELRCKGNALDRACVKANIDYLPDFGAGTTTISWSLAQEDFRGVNIYSPGVDGVISQPFGDPWPDPSNWRLEADTAGDVRLYYRHNLLAEAVFPDMPQGDKVGLTLFAGAGQPPAGAVRPMNTRIEQVWAGLQEPLGTEELGIWIRIGVHHTTLGNQWFLRGCVDGLVPTYVPDRPDAVRIECIDTLGEAGRVRIIGDQLPHEFAPAPNRIHQILNHAHWPRNLRVIHDDSTIMSRPANGKAVDALTHVAESCGGAVWSEPRNGNIVFKGQDWQGEVAAGPSIALITNARPDDDTLTVPRVCPVGWEQSAHREDMNTRVRYSSVTSQGEDREPLVREWRAPKAEAVYGVELYERTVLCVNPDRLGDLARRQLRLRHPNQFPRVQAVLLDAATADEALDLMTTADWTIPSKYRCQLRRPGEYVFNRAYLVTGIQHTMTPERWTCRLALDLAVALAEVGGRWDEARWQTAGDTWGRSR